MTKALVIETNGSALHLELGGPGESYAKLRDAVGGYIELIRVLPPDHPYEPAFAYINEEGKLRGLLPNLAATQLCRDNLRPGDYIAGPAVIVGAPDSEGNETDAPQWVFDIEWAIPVAARLREQGLWAPAGAHGWAEWGECDDCEDPYELAAPPGTGRCPQCEAKLQRELGS